MNIKNIKFKEKIRVVGPAEISALEVFIGSPGEQIPELLALGRSPLTMAGVMERCLEDEERTVGTSEDAEILRNTYLTTATSMFRNSAGDVLFSSYDNNPVAKKIVLGLNHQSYIQNSSLMYFEGMNINDMYNAVKEGGDHLVISAEAVRNIQNNPCAEKIIRAGVWEVMAEGNFQLDKDYGTMVDKKTGVNFDNNRGLWLPPFKGGSLVWRGSVGSCDSMAGLGAKEGRFVGVYDGVAESSINFPTLEETLAVVNSPDLDRLSMVDAINELYKQ